LQGFLFSKAVSPEEIKEMLNPAKREKLIRLASSNA
jgi:EAL domain-containing protein (putative c-di-GMP-specific phosphodiesterase class I)